MPRAEAPAASDADFALGRQALLEITSEATIGAPCGSVDEGDGVVSVHFATTLPGYPGWRWTASIAHLDGAEPKVLETELTPGTGALLAPDWIPWADRLAEYRAAQKAAEAEAGESLGGDDEGDLDEDDELDDDELDDDVDDDDDLDEDDLDGVDIDEVDPDDADSVDEDSADEDSADEDVADEAGGLATQG
jgi:hypothetical protein